MDDSEIERLGLQAEALRDSRVFQIAGARHIEQLKERWAETRPEQAELRDRLYQELLAFRGLLSEIGIMITDGRKVSTSKSYRKGFE